MHPNPAFRTATDQRNLDFARGRGFGLLALNGPDAPLMSHIPFLLDQNGEKVELHLVRSNPIARHVSGPMPARIAVSGPDSYISPDWYGVPDQVPTWNYVAVHLSGTLVRQSGSALRSLIDRQSAFFEDRLAPKHPWSTHKMTDDVLERMMRQIEPFVLTIEAVDGTWKLNQNKPDEARVSAADQVEGFGIGSETAMLSAMMRGVRS